MNAESLLQAAPPLVTICGPEGYTPEQWAKMAAYRIISIADTAPAPIRDQAYAFKAHMEQVITACVQAALESDRQLRSVRS